MRADADAGEAALAKIAPTLRPPEDLKPRLTVAMTVLYSLPLEGVIALRDDAVTPTDDGEPTFAQHPSDLLLILQMAGPAATNPSLRSEAIQTLRSQGPIQTDGYSRVGIPERIVTVVAGRERDAIVSTLARPDGSQVRQSQSIIDADGGPLVVVLRRSMDRFEPDEVRRLIESVPWRGVQEAEQRALDAAGSRRILDGGAGADASE